MIDILVALLFFGGIAAIGIGFGLLCIGRVAGTALMFWGVVATVGSVVLDLMS